MEYSSSSTYSQKMLHSIWNKSPKFIQIYHYYSSYSCSSSYSTLWGGIDEIDGILLQFYLHVFPTKFCIPFTIPLFHQSFYSQKLSKGIQSNILIFLEIFYRFGTGCHIMKMKQCQYCWIQDLFNKIFDFILFESKNFLDMPMNYSLTI